MNALAYNYKLSRILKLVESSHDLTYKMTYTAPIRFLTNTKSPHSKKSYTASGRKSTLADGPSLNPSIGSTSVSGRVTADCSSCWVLWRTTRDEKDDVFGRERSRRLFQRRSWLSQPMETSRWLLPRKHRSAMNDWWPVKTNHIILSISNLAPAI